jgi:subtilisin family serine protease
MHRCGSAHSGRNRSAWTLILSSLAAAAIGLAVVGDAQAIDRPGDARNRAAKSAAPKNASRVAPKAAPRPKALINSNPAVSNPNRAGTQPNHGLPRGAGNAGTNDLRRTGATTNNSQQPHAATDPRNRQNAAIDPRNRPNATTGVRNRFNPADPRSRLNAAAGPRNRLNGAADPRNRFNAGNPRNGFNTAAAGPRNRMNGFNQRGRLNTADYRRQLLDHRRLNFLARSRVPLRPYFGERGFTGVPPVGERRYVTNEMVLHVGANVSRRAVDDLMRKHGMSIAGAESMSLTGGTMYQVRVANNKAMTDVVRELEAENIGLAQPNYVFHLQRDVTAEQGVAAPQDAASQAAAPQDTAAAPPEGPVPAAADTTLAARPAGGDPSQYVVNKLKLGEVHRIATGKNVLVAVIDSQVDAAHPDLARSIFEQYDAVGRRDKPDAHGTGMTGAIAAQRKLLGVAPGAKILAIHAFSPDASDSPQATTKHILAGLEYAIKKGARVINMSFAGPYDPVLQLAMKKAREKGVVLIAAAGNAGPKSPPLFPAADPNVIAVTATDANDKIFAKANRGPQVALAAPGVEILEPATNGGYQLTTGTSVAAAHVSGVAALLIERDPTADAATIEEILTMSARNLAPGGRDDDFGWGLVDPVNALLEIDAKVARDRDPNSAKPAPSAPAVASRPATVAPTSKPTVTRTGTAAAR